MRHRQDASIPVRLSLSDVSDVVLEWRMQFSAGSLASVLLSNLIVAQYPQSWLERAELSALDIG